MPQEFCYITTKPDGIYVETSYNPEFVELIKRHVPWDHRRWDPETKTWWISHEYAAQIRIDATVQFEKVIEV